MKTTAIQYKAPADDRRLYLLTFWEERSHDLRTPIVWRFNLKDPNAAQRRGFEDLREMVPFLQHEVV